MYLKDVPEGSEGVIEGYADAESVKVIIKLFLKGPGGKAMSVTHAVYPRNLQLTSDYRLATAGEQASSGEPGRACSSTDDPGTAEDSKNAPKWVLGESEPRDVHVETKWASMLADGDDLTKTMNVKGPHFHTHD